MLSPLSRTIQGVMRLTWPMIFISVVILVSLRLTYLYKNKQRLILYKELLMLAFAVYVLCLFQVVTFQDVVNWSSNNFIPLKEILRYDFGSRLFIKNVLGNVLMFLPYGFFSSYYLKLNKITPMIGLTLIASFAIEGMQLVIGRVFDIDDILLNVIGGLLGYLLYRLLKRVGDSVPKILQAEWFLNIISIGIVVLMVFIVL